MKRGISVETCWFEEMSLRHDIDQEKRDRHEHREHTL